MADHETVTKDWRVRDFPVTFCWDISYFCNYRCSYCWFEASDQWADLARRYPLEPIEKWLAAWEKMHSLYGTVKIDIVGGEPLLYPGGQELFTALARRHRIHITTNLSLPAARFEALLSAVTPDTVRFQASFHPEFADLPAFLEGLALLQRGGYEPSVSYVTWPPSLPKMSHYRDVFGERGVALTPLTFQGVWEGKAYPESFTQEQKDLIASFLPRYELKPAEVKYRLERHGTMGKLCHSGRVYANLKPNGDVYRCGQVEVGSMGNIFDPDFRLYDAPKPCPYRHCSCKEFRYLDEVFGLGDREAAVPDPTAPDA